MSNNFYKIMAGLAFVLLFGLGQFVRAQIYPSFIPEKGSAGEQLIRENGGEMFCSSSSCEALRYISGKNLEKCGDELTGCTVKCPTSQCIEQCGSSYNECNYQLSTPFQEVNSPCAESCAKSCSGSSLPSCVSSCTEVCLEGDRRAKELEKQDTQISPPKKEAPKETKPAKKAVRKLTNQEIQAITVYLFGAMGYDADDFDRAMETIDDVFKAARGLPSRKELNNRALTKRKDADKEFIEAARDGRIKDSATREKIRKMYYDSWLDNPQDKKTDMMMAIFEKDKGHKDTADVFEKFAYMNFSQKEKNTLTAAVNKAKEGMGEKLMGEKVNQTLLKNQLEASSFMNLLRQNVNGEIAKAKETAKDACYGNSACDWAWTKKVGIITEAQKLSQNVSDLMDGPIKAAFGMDRKQIKKELYGQTN